MIKEIVGNHKVLLVIGNVLVLVAGVALSLPYGFYTLLRFCVCFSSLYFAYLIYGAYQNKFKTYIIFITIATLYNPFIKISFEKEVWSIINLVTAIIIIIPLGFRRFRHFKSNTVK